MIEAGGCVAGTDGAPLPPAPDLTVGVSLIAAANRALCDEILDRLGDDGGWP